MNMRAPINRLPAGFLGFVDVKAMGENPRTFLSEVQPGMDMRPFYTAGGRIFITSTAVAVAGVGTTPLLTVPQNKAWAAESMTVSTVGILGAGVSFTMCCAILDANGNRLWIGEKDVETTGGLGLARMNFPDVYIALPGYQFAVICTRIAAGPVSVIGSLTYVEGDY
jgi:hypothetical protein